MDDGTLAHNRLVASVDSTRSANPCGAKNVIRNELFMREEWERRRAERLYALDLRIV